MAKLIFDSCCCCFNLKKACMTIGYLQFLKRRLVLVYLYYMAFCFILTTIATIVGMVMDDVHFGILYVIFMVPHGYCLMVIRSYYYKMDEINVSERGTVHNAEAPLIQ